MDVNALSTNPLNANPQPTNLCSVSGSPQALDLENYALTTDGQHWRDLVEPDNADHVFSSLNWLWPFEEFNDEIMDAPDASAPF
ncbi:hypothetical protein BDV12DRAFT_179275 [Aspergillus spectabilis]